MRFAGIAFIVACTLVLGRPCLHMQVQPNINHVTAPMSVEGNVPIVTLTFKRPDGSLRAARFIFDSGGGAVILDEGLAADLGLKPEGGTISDEGQRYRAVDVPAAFVSGMPVDLRSSKAFVHLGATSFTNRDTVEGLLPGKALESIKLSLIIHSKCCLLAKPVVFRTGERDCSARMLHPADTRESRSESAETTMDSCSIPEPNSHSFAKTCCNSGLRNIPIGLKALEQ
jgi:hypothetical protein